MLKRKMACCEMLQLILSHSQEILKTSGLNKTFLLIGFYNLLLFFVCFWVKKKRHSDRGPTAHI